MKNSRNAGLMAIAVTTAAMMALGAAGEAAAAQVKLDVALGTPVLIAGKKQTTYLKVGLTGFHVEDVRHRAPVNVAIVLDKSGSMSGEKIRKAKEAAMMVLERLNSRDIISVVAYDHNVQVIVPATKLSDVRGIRAAIRGLEAGGNTALFAGVSKGAAEARKFLARNRVNRVILLSDGLANVGPSSTGALGSLGSSLIKEGISVTTIGLGLDYNEDLLTELARRSDGNHAFAEDASDLARIFKYEFGDVLSVAAQEVAVRIDCARGIRPIRVLGREADIVGGRVTAYINQIYGGQEKYILLEVEIPSGAAGTARDVATVSVSYANMQTGETDRLTGSVGALYSGSGEVVERETNKGVMIEAARQVGRANNDLAVVLRDEGKIDEAKKILGDNTIYLKGQARLYGSFELEKEAEFNKGNAEGLEDKDWRRTRKDMRDLQYKQESQRAW